MGYELSDWYGGGTDTAAPVWPPSVSVSGEAFEQPESWAERATAAAVGGLRLSAEPADALVLGRFDPPHVGHAFLLAAARRVTTGRVVACIFSRAADEVPASLRLHTLQTVMPGHLTTREVKVDEDFPVGAPEPRRWAAWFAQSGLEGKVGALVTSDPNAAAFAEAARLRLVLVDPTRKAFPISASAIRADPWATWDAICPPARSHFAKLVALVGPEGGGKSTLARALGLHYRTSFNDEYLGLLVGGLQRPLRPADLAHEGLAGQRETNASVRFRARRFGFVDSDVLNLKLWHDRLFPEATPFELAPTDWCHHTLVVDDHPWTGDPKRDEPAARRRMVHDAVQALESNGRSYTLIGGPREERLARAIAAVDAWVATRPHVTVRS